MVRGTDMNDLDSELVVIGLPNVFARLPLNRESLEEGKVLYVDAFVEPLINAAAKSNPHWQFVSYGGGWFSERGCKFINFSVIHNRQVLGKISTDYFGHNKVFEIANPRIGKELSRGRSKRTKDLKQALKFIAKYFRVDTSHELLNDSLGVVRDVLYKIASRADGVFYERYRVVSRELVPEIMGQWDQTYRILAVKHNVPTSIIESIVDTYHSTVYANKVNTCMQNDKGVAILVRGDDYLVSHSAHAIKNMQVFTTDTLPISIKRAVGMLKLVPEYRMLDGVGVRLREDLFYVTADEEQT